MRNQGVRRASFALGVAFLSAIPAVSRGDQPPADLTILRSARLGLPILVRAADGGAIPIQAPVAQAAAAPADFFRAHGTLLGVSDAATQLSQIESHVDGLGWSHTSFQQVHAGVAVFSGILKVHQDAAGAIRVVNGRFYPISAKLSVNPSINPDSAAQIAASVLPVGSLQTDRSELVIVDPGWYGDSATGTQLAYHVILSSLDADVREAFFVQAHTGEILDQWSMVCTALFRQVSDATGGLPGVLVKDEDGPPPVPPVGDVEIDHGFDYAGDTYGYFFRGFGRDGIDGTDSIIRLSMRRPNSCPNASWNGVYSSFCIGVSSDDVVGHEMTHGVTQFTAGLIYQNQSGQLNESFSDVFGELVDLFNGDASFAGPPGGTPWPTPPPVGPGTDVPNNMRTAACSAAPAYPDGVRWMMGEDATGFATAIRDMWNPPCRNHPDTANSPFQTCSATDAGGVHSGSGVPNHAFAMLTDGKTFNGHTVIGIGPIKSGAVWYRALSEYLTPASDFEDAYAAFNQAAADLVGTFPNDPRTGAPAASAFTATDAVQVNEALLAVEMNTPGACGAGDDVVVSDPAEECPGAVTLFDDSFESGVNGWTVSNTAPPTPYDWVRAGSLPFGRPGTAWFCADPNFANCSSVVEAGVHSLFSPVIATPPVLHGPTVAFTHYMATEGSWDAGNLKISVNGGAWSVVPRTAFRFNPYNARINSVAQGNENPLAGEPGWSGAGGRWGRSVVDLGGLVGGGQTIQFRFDFGKDGCTGSDGWYVDDFSFHDCPDCDGDGAADIAQFHFAAASDSLGNIGTGFPQSFTIVSPPTAAGDVLLSFTARGDFASAGEFVDVDINGTAVGTVFTSSAGDCPLTPDRQSLTVPAAAFNAAVGAGDAVITMTASADVAPGITACNGESYITVFVRYPRSAQDCNANLTLDPCEVRAAGVTPFVNALLGVAPFDCIYDFVPDTVLNGRDISGFVTVFLGP